MIKRPGCEGYLQKLVEEERKAISLKLRVAAATSCVDFKDSDKDEDSSNDGLVMSARES